MVMVVVVVVMVALSDGDVGGNSGGSGGHTDGVWSSWSMLIYILMAETRPEQPPLCLSLFLVYLMQILDNAGPEMKIYL